MIGRLSLMALLGTASAVLAAPAIAQVHCLPERTPSLDASYFASARIYSQEWDISNGEDRSPTTYYPLVQELVLKSGEYLEVTATGCHDHANNYRFILPRTERGIDDLAYWLERAANLLDELAPANLDEHLRLEPVAGWLREEAAKARKAGAIDPSALGGTIIAGPTNNHLSFGVQAVDEQIHLTMTYQFNP